MAISFIWYVFVLHLASHFNSIWGYRRCTHERLGHNIEDLDTFLVEAIPKFALLPGLLGSGPSLMHPTLKVFSFFQWIKKEENFRMYFLSNFLHWNNSERKIWCRLQAQGTATQQADLNDPSMILIGVTLLRVYLGYLLFILYAFY